MHKRKDNYFLSILDQTINNKNPYKLYELGSEKNLDFEFFCKKFA